MEPQHEGSEPILVLVMIPKSGPGPFMARHTSHPARF
jgi:hypothetical protein